MEHSFGLAPLARHSAAAVRRRLDLNAASSPRTRGLNGDTGRCRRMSMNHGVFWSDAHGAHE